MFLLSSHKSIANYAEKSGIDVAPVLLAVCHVIISAYSPVLGLTASRDVSQYPKPAA